MSLLRFLTVYFNVFPRQIARYPPPKTEKYPRKKLSNLIRVKFRQTLKFSIE